LIRNTLASTEDENNPRRMPSLKEATVCCGAFQTRGCGIHLSGRTQETAINPCSCNRRHRVVSLEGYPGLSFI